MSAGSAVQEVPEGCWCEGHAGAAGSGITCHCRGLGSTLVHVSLPVDILHFLGCMGASRQLAACTAETNLNLSVVPFGNWASVPLSSFS